MENNQRTTNSLTAKQSGGYLTRCVLIAASIAQIDNHYSVTQSLCTCRAARAAKKDLSQRMPLCLASRSWFQVGVPVMDKEWILSGILKHKLDPSMTLS